MERNTAFYVNWKGRHIKILPEEVRLIEIMKDYCVLHLADTRVMTDDSVEKIMSCLPENGFLNVRHKYLVNLQYISGINDHHINIGTITIPLRAKLLEKYSHPW